MRAELTGIGRIGRMVLLAAFVFGLGQARAQSAPEDLEALRRMSLELVNEARRQEQLQPLQLGPEMNQAAQSHAADMLERDYYAHVSPEGTTVMDRYRSAGGSENRLVAENIAQCRNCPVPADGATVESLHEGWMNSPEHRENILAEGLSRYGFGLAEDETGTRYAVQTFAGPGKPRGTEAGEVPEPIGPAAQTELAVSLVNAERADDAPRVSAEPRLIEAAGNAIPDGDLSEVSLEELRPLEEILPDGLPWQSFQMIVGSCGGCGVDATDADVRFFLEEWLDDARYRDILTGPALTSMGLTIEADGRGRKLAVAILAGG